MSALLDSFSDESPDTFEVRMKNAGVKEGGKYIPNDCLAQSKIAIIVPYRNLKTDLDVLDVFLRYMHPFLQRQQLDYSIFVVEQAGKLHVRIASLLIAGPIAYIIFITVRSLTILSHNRHNRHRRLTI